MSDQVESYIKSLALVLDRDKTSRDYIFEEGITDQEFENRLSDYTLEKMGR